MKVYQTGQHEDFSVKDQFKFLIHEKEHFTFLDEKDISSLDESYISKEADKLIGEF